MASGRYDRLALVTLALATACGARGGLDLSGPDVDAAVVDAAPPRDSGRPRRDAGPPDAGTLRCSAGERFEIARQPGRLDWPAIARVGESGLLVFTAQDGDRSPRIFVQPMSSLGVPVRPPAEVTGGEGGTLVPKWLADVAPGFTLAFRTPDRQVGGARFHDHGSLDGVAGVGFGPTDSRRPGLLLTDRLAVNAWNGDADVGLRGFVQDLRDPIAADLVLGGQRDPVVASTARDDTLLLASHDGRLGRVAEYDAGGAMITERFIDASDGTFPFATRGTLVVEGAPDAAVVWGGAIRALESSTVRAELGTASASWTQENDLIHDAAAAFDPSADVLGIAAAIRHDEGIGRMPTPHVFVYLLQRHGAVQDFVLAGPLLEDEPRELHVAMMETGVSTTPFLAVWTEIDGGDGVVAGALVICP